GLPWAIFGNAFSVEEDKEQETKDLFEQEGWVDFGAITLSAGHPGPECRNGLHGHRTDQHG
ncbi:MAG TPA: hypothetical protein PKV69_08955, partial [Candidatus Hydrogenedentes bacterium]|nr:hypothetical protein [Candidatus Hydrogenedentota bacterium]